MVDLLSLLNPNADNLQNQVMMQQLQQKYPNSFSEGNPDPLARIQSASNPMPAQRAVPQSNYSPTSGSEMEADAHSSIDDLMSKLEAQRNQYRAQDATQQWMSFFSKLASSKNPRLLGGLGEGAEALTEVRGKQNANNQLLDQAALQDQIKYREWEQDQKRQQQLADQTGAYQKAEIGLKNAALAQDNIQVIPDGMGGFIQYDKRHPNSIKAVDTGSGGSGDASQSSIKNVYTPPLGEDGNPLRGEDYLKTVPAPIAAQARLYMKGDAPPPTGFAAKPMLLAAQQVAATADPTWNGQRYSTIQDFTKGPQTAKTVQAQNVTMEHISTLKDAVDALDNGDVRMFNKLSQEVARQSGSAVPTNFELGKNIVYDEMAKAILGNNSALADRQAFVKNMDTGSSRKQALGQLDEAGKYMAGQAYGLENRYTAGSGLTNYRQRFMTPAARKLIEKYYPSPSDSGGSSKDTTPSASTDFSHLWSQ